MGVPRDPRRSARRARGARPLHPDVGRPVKAVTYAEAYAERWPTVDQILAEIYPRRRRRVKETTAADSNSPKSSAVGGRRRQA